MPSHKKAKKIVNAVSPEPQPRFKKLPLSGLELEELRQKRELGFMNRHRIGEILRHLNSISQITDFKSHYREAVGGLFYVIDEAHHALLRLTGAPGIIGQSELEAAYRDIETWRQGNRSIMPEPVFFARIRDLVVRYRGGWLVEAGNFRLCPSQNELICVSKGKSKGQGHGPKPRQVDPVPGAPNIETPSVETLETWFDLPSEPPHAEGSPTES